MSHKIYLTDKQVADRYGVKRGSVWRWTKVNNQFPKPVKLSPGCARWLTTELENFEKKSLRSNTSSLCCPCKDEG